LFSNLSKLSKAALLITAASIAALFSGGVPASAVGGPAPDLFINHASCYQNIGEDGDIYCLASYELPNSDSDGVSDEWCAELVNQDGCDGTPADPTEPTSLPQNYAFLTLYRDCSLNDCSAGDLLNVTRIPRIGFGLAGSYVDPGHSITYGDESVALCVESSETLYTSPTQDCQNAVWSEAGSAQADQRTALGEDMVLQVFGIGLLESRPFSYYVSGDLINSTGKTLALEALENADRILDVFSSGAVTIGITGPTPNAGATVQADIDSSTGNVTAAIDGFGTAIGTSGEITGVIISLIITFAIFIAGAVLTRNLIFALTGAVAFATVLVIFGFLPFQVLAVLIAILALPAGVKVVRMVSP
jgi:hypothetical protein